MAFVKVHGVCLLKHAALAAKHEFSNGYTKSEQMIS